MRVRKGTAEKTVKLSGCLLAVDVGIRTGFAVYDETGTLVQYGSHNYGSVSRLKQAAWGHLSEIRNLHVLVLEGGGTLAEVWQHTAQKRGIRVIQLYAETWRKDLLYQREQRTGKMAKSFAEEVARKVIRESNLPAPKALRHDAAEAILVGKWAIFYGGVSGDLQKEGE
ncbi:MAG: hypothetical protein JNN12_00580 [Bacteroidetes Order II. Incertae sedis bacterium]|nr:hypothetical protein [Bacteroidetes Order II. bacterium]